MFDKYLLVDGTARVLETGDGPAFEVDTRIAYYRGLGLSMVEDVSLTIDGMTYPPEATTFTVHGNTYAVSELAAAVDDRWGFTEKATVRVRTDERLAAGKHTVTFSERLRISYIPAPTVTSDTKVLSVET